MLAALTLPLALVIPAMHAPAAVHAPAVHRAFELQQASSPSSELLFPSTTLASGFAAKEEKVLTEEEEQARNDARRTFAIIVFVSAVPSFWAQDVLVWSKEKEDKKKK